jgi:hypothetical protein
MECTEHDLPAGPGRHAILGSNLDPGRAHPPGAD